LINIGNTVYAEVQMRVIESMPRLLGRMVTKSKDEGQGFLISKLRMKLF